MKDLSGPLGHSACFFCATGHRVSLYFCTEITNWSYPAWMQKYQVIADQLFVLFQWLITFTTLKSCVLLPIHISLVSASSPSVSIFFSPGKYADAVKKSPLNHRIFGKLTRMNLSSFSEVSLPTPVFILRLFSYRLWFRMWLQSCMLYASIALTSTIYGNKNTSTSLHPT